MKEQRLREKMLKMKREELAKAELLNHAGAVSHLGVSSSSGEGDRGDGRSGCGGGGGDTFGSVMAAPPLSRGASMGGDSGEEYDGGGAGEGGTTTGEPPPHHHHHLHHHPQKLPAAVASSANHFVSKGQDRAGIRRDLAARGAIPRERFAIIGAKRERERECV